MHKKIHSICYAALLVLLFPACLYAQDTQKSPVKVKIRCFWKYTVKHNDHRQRAQENDNSKAKPVKESRYITYITMENRTDKPIYLWMRRCSWEDNFMTNNSYTYFMRRSCDSNFPVLVKVRRHGKIKYMATLCKTKGAER